MKLILSLLIAAAIMMMAESAAPVAAQGAATWRPDSHLASQLAPSPVVAGFTLEHPNGYEMQTMKGSQHISATFWASPVRADGTRGWVMATYLTPPAGQTNKLTLPAFLTKSLASVRSSRLNWSQSAPQQGAIHGHLFYRAYWQGRLPSTETMHGFVYVTRVKNQYVELTSQDYFPEQKAALALAEASVLTFRTK